MTSKQEMDAQKQKFIYALTFYLITLSAAFIGFATFGMDFEDKPESLRIADTVIGFLLGVVISTIINYFIGTSQSSADKTGAMLESATEDRKRIDSVIAPKRAPAIEET